jgi:hypothetical protein
MNPLIADSVDMYDTTRREAIVRVLRFVPKGYHEHILGALYSFAQRDVTGERFMDDMQSLLHQSQWVEPHRMEQLRHQLSLPNGKLLPIRLEAIQLAMDVLVRMLRVKVPADRAVRGDSETFSAVTKS